ncbi:hypothetical protein EMIHUDRAFT_469649 [Emiliania huxleyi CCMP1516]|uniref:DnaJ homolog subfamily C member 22 n=2 Tax=Emiliania huxleyi TaxID=2903 RepID=A0A0D3JFZ3_EMIH1|nr:hypothetical protein EMIHUDRAFT_469649 [Emiliania huxleyi CCMP1516]EOD22428.1 hypothetical protein EMIHUDRAFT_469649 [Emiliania huxleyi CCMP1516]|eukprot:XP_005774857.1 hypothetical protein EMIHUDRAFT_469649 [Emiliania huxleyi CCMP1516]
MRNATSMALRALLLVALLADGAPDQSPGRGVRRQPTLLAVDGRALAEMGALRLSGSAAAANVGAVSATVRSWWTKGGVMDTAGGALLALKAYTLWFFFGLLGLHHVYLGRPRAALRACLTLNYLGLGWLYDGISLPLRAQALRLSLAPGAAGEGGVEEEGDAAAVLPVLATVSVDALSRLMPRRWFEADLPPSLSRRRRASPAGKSAAGGHRLRALAVWGSVCALALHAAPVSELGLSSRPASWYSAKEVKAAYRQLSLQLHPDKIRGASPEARREAENRFMRGVPQSEVAINAAKR